MVAMVRAVVSGVLLTVLMVAPPTCLVVWGGPPWQLLRHGLDAIVAGQVDAVLWHVLYVAGWAWWSAVVCQIVQAAVAVHREARWARTGDTDRTPTRQQARLNPGRGGFLTPWSYKGLVGGLLLAPVTLPTTVALPATAVAHTWAAEEAAQDGHPEDRPPAMQQAAPARQARALAQVTVAASGPSASLWGLAEHYLGDGMRWRDIWQLNAGREQPDGSSMQSPDVLIPGWTVLVPVSNPQQDAAGASSRTNDDRGDRERSLLYTVAAGDRLGDIAMRFLGDFEDYKTLQRANQQTIRDPDLIDTGDTILIPAPVTDRGRTEHAGGVARPQAGSATPTPQAPPEAHGEPGKPEPAPSTPPATPPAREDIEDAASRVSAGEEAGDMPWALPAAAAAAAVTLLAAQSRRRGRRASQTDDEDAGSPRHRRPRASSSIRNLADEGEDERPDAADPLEPDADLERHASTVSVLHTDDAIDQARLLIHDSVQALFRSQRDADDTNDTDDTDDTAEADERGWPADSDAVAQQHAVRVRPEAHRQEPPPTGSPTSPASPVLQATPMRRDAAATPPQRLADPAIAVVPQTAGETGDHVRHVSDVAEHDAPEHALIPSIPSSPPTRNYAATPLGAYDSQSRAGSEQPFTISPGPSPVNPAPTWNGQPLTHARPSGAVQKGAQPRAHIKLFGDPAILDAQGNRVPGVRKHALHLLLYLALHRDGAELRALRELIWPDATLTQAMGRLSTEVANLRRSVRHALGEPGNQNINAVLNSGGHYQLADFLDIDLWAFQDALAAASALHANNVANAAGRDGGSTEQSRPEHSSQHEQALRRAVALHTGRFADRKNLDATWLPPERRRINRAGARARIALAELLHTQHPDQARTLLNDAAQLDPSDHQLRQQIIRVGERLTGQAQPTPPHS
ncbi:hypothetical protein Kisp01_69460 [Kineosporia sp. NBRC 101677]|uniref:LysM peptidoglycan-binding domain-containing protein n=1 Tax=Kineosporia sp. NBRC 101677 TaxID=3032197 RepID=UPI0024A29B6D|nr:LysM peptidoglycan-binding domain-containing protein [Kineosporia sp. NBRC 101677]GLY19932.1 hypothetical protein Kisp01_69460 [Kineosporia sp. NBRC 101677]